MNDKTRFLHEYGCDGYKIIAAYEEACDTPHQDKFANWFGDLGVFEASLNPDITYDKLCERYNNGLKLLGIINEQTDKICCEFTSSELAEHIRNEKVYLNANEYYLPESILAKRNVFEFTKEHLAIDGDLELDDVGHEITAAFECWFDVEDKFALKIDNDDVWVNMYGKYNPFVDDLQIECVLSKPNDSIPFYYTPTENETMLIKDLISQKIRLECNQSPMEFCQDICSEKDLKIGGI